MGILRLFENANLIMKYDDRDDCNLFDFRKPNSTWSISAVPQSVEHLPPAYTRPSTSRERYERILVVVPEESTGAEFIGVRPVLRCGTYHSMAYIIQDSHVRLWCIAVIIGSNVVPLGTGRVFPEFIRISQSSAASFITRGA